MTMRDKPNDLLLLAGKVLAVFMQIAMAVGACALVVASIALLFYRDTLIAEYAADVGDPTAVFPVFALLGVMLIGIALVAALFVFFGKLRQIIGTVGEGDPFQPANAERLSIMAWLMLGVQLLMLPATALGIQLARFADELDDVNVTVDGGFDLTGILIVILLFILARVFKHGAAMREDLEGTV
jgi:hypothetical protein